MLFSYCLVVFQKKKSKLALNVIIKTQYKIHQAAISCVLNVYFSGARWGLLMDLNQQTFSY